MFVEVFKMSQPYNNETYEDSKMISMGLVNDNLIFNISNYPYYFPNGMKHIKGNWYYIKFRNEFTGFRGYDAGCMYFINEETYKKIVGDSNA